MNIQFFLVWNYHNSDGIELKRGGYETNFLKIILLGLNTEKNKRSWLYKRITWRRRLSKGAPSGHSIIQLHAFTVFTQNPSSHSLLFINTSSPTTQSHLLLSDLGFYHRCCISQTLASVYYISCSFTRFPSIELISYFNFDRVWSDDDDLWLGLVRRNGQIGLADHPVISPPIFWVSSYSIKSLSIFLFSISLNFSIAHLSIGRWLNKFIDKHMSELIHVENLIFSMRPFFFLFFFSLIYTWI